MTVAKNSLPWENDQLIIEYEFVNPRKRFSERYAFVITFILIASGIISKYKVILIPAFFLLISLITKKYVVVSSRGLEIYTDMKITKNYTLWNWEEIDALTFENTKEHPDLVLFYFTKGDVTKKFFFKNKYRKDILDKARKHNKQIKVYDAKKYRAMINGK